MSEHAAPQTCVDEIKIPIEDMLHLSVRDGVPEVMQKGLYQAPEGQVVAIADGDEIVAVATAGKLRGAVLPRSWHGPLGDWLHRLSPPPEVVARMPVANLDLLVQEVTEVDWLLVVDETGQPVGVLERALVVNEYLPPFDTTQKVHRLGGENRLWGDPQVDHSYWYCPIENRVYLPHAVHPDAEGQMRDRKGHPVEKREPSQRR